MQQFWVICGAGHSHAPTLMRGLSTYVGPFATYGAAEREWKRHDRIRRPGLRVWIERIDPDGPPPCTD